MGGPRQDIFKFFREIYGEKTVECVKHHNKTKLNKSGPCFFNKIMLQVLQNDRMESETVWKEWMENNIDIVLCSMNKAQVAQMDGMTEKDVDMNEIWKTTNLNRLAEGVARVACLEMIRMCDEREQKGLWHIGYGCAMYCASHYGHADIVNMCGERREEKFCNSTYCISELGDPNIRFVKRERSDNLNRAMRGAARRGHAKIVKMCKDWGANDYNGTMGGAAAGGYIEIVKTCKEWGARNFDDVMWKAARYGHIEIVELCRKWGASRFNDAMYLASGSGQIEIVKLCKEMGGR